MAGIRREPILVPRVNMPAAISTGYEGEVPRPNGLVPRLSFRTARARHTSSTWTCAPTSTR